MDIQSHATDNELARGERPAIWFEHQPAPRGGHAHRSPLEAPTLRTWRVGQGAGRSDDARLVALIVGLGAGSPAACGTFRVGILDGDGAVYRVVRLYCTYEALVFTARMHALGFRHFPAHAAQGDYDVTFYAA